MAATDDTKYISLAGLGHFVDKLKNNKTYDDNVVSNKILLGTAEIDSGLRFPGESDTTGNNEDAENSGLVLSNSVLKSRGREINWSNLSTTTNLNFITSPGVYTITGHNDSSADETTSTANLPYLLKAGGKFQVRLTVTRVLSGSNTKYEKVIQHIDYIDSNEKYGVFMRKGNRYYDNSTSGSTSKPYTWTLWSDLNKDTEYTLPVASSGALGGIKIGYEQNDKNYAVQLNDGKAFVNVPWTDTKYTHPTSGAAGSYGPSLGTTLSHGESFNVPYVKVNAQGHVTEASTKTMTLPTISTATNSVFGGIKIGYSEGGKNYAVQLNSDGKAYVNVPWTDTNITYSNATTTAAGLMSAADKSKLDDIEDGANNYALPAATANTLGGIKLGYSQSDKNYPVQLSDGKAYVNVPWTDTKIKSESNTGQRYLLGRNTTAATDAVIEVNTHSKCYMQGGYLYSNSTKVETKMTTTINETVDITTPIKLSPNKCIIFTKAQNINFELDTQTLASGEINTYMFCFKSDGTTYVGPSYTLDNSKWETQRTNLINLFKDVLWLDGELPPFLFRNSENNGTVEPTPEYTTPAGFYEVIFTKYGNTTNLAYDGDTNGRTATITATWAYYC